MGFSLGGNLATKIGVDNQDNLDAMVIEGAFNNYRDVGIDHTPKIFSWDKMFPLFRGIIFLFCSKLKK